MVHMQFFGRFDSLLSNVLGKAKNIIRCYLSFQFFVFFILYRVLALGFHVVQPNIGIL